MPEKTETPDKVTEAPSKEPETPTKDLSDNKGSKDYSDNKSSSSKEERPGIAHIYSSGNNTIVHITDLAGNTLSRVSGGMITKHSRLKANPTNAMFVAKQAAERAKDLGINSLYVRMKGKTDIGSLGPGAHAAVKSLGKEGFKIISIVEVTKFPRGGPKKKGGRRGRRV
ncbi:30S ribosomal protein S11 [Candidatus Pacearchaeota archaeon]|nr:30S ribosomal protein S11 [Candidatus Pacearchaeota archaeon]|tara:strand:- start:3882 stop:4388 length:507 start_codon:yes stop_codon:yes gene_type:complete